MQNLVTNRADQEEIQNERVEKIEWNKNIHGPRGIGGWLLVPFIGMLISIVLVARQLFSSEIYDADWTTILTFGAVFKGMLVLYCCYVIFEFLRKKPIVPRLMIIFYYMNLIGIIIETSLLLTTVEATSEEIKLAYWSIAQNFLVCIIWIPYFKLSDRVDNTFSDCWKS